MKRLLENLTRNNKGQALPMVLILLLLGGLIISPLLMLAGSGLKTGKVYEEAAVELYAADAGVEDALYKLISSYTPLESLAVGESYSYSLPLPVNSLPVGVTLTRLSLLEGVLGNEEYKPDQPHEGWVTFDTPIAVVRTDGYVEYSCTIAFHYTGTGSRTLQALGLFFAPFPGDKSLITGPYQAVPSPVITFNYLEADSPETIVAPGGFAFVWTWQKNKGPVFDKRNGDGSLSFRFRINNPRWEASFYFCFATVKEQDVSFVTDQPASSKWLVEATARDTKIRSLIAEDAGQVAILTWEVRR